MKTEKHFFSDLTLNFVDDIFEFSCRKYFNDFLLKLMFRETYRNENCFMESATLKI